MAGERDKAFRLGASDFMTKPVDPTRLATVLKRYSRTAAGPRILVVDDNEQRQRLRDVLEKKPGGG